MSDKTPDNNRMTCPKCGHPDLIGSSEYGLSRGRFSVISECGNGHRFGRVLSNEIKTDPSGTSLEWYSGSIWKIPWLTLGTAPMLRRVGAGGKETP